MHNYNFNVDVKYLFVLLYYYYYFFKLDDVNWMVNITTATDTEPQKFHPSAMIELKVNNLSSSEVREDRSRYFKFE